MRLEFHHYHTLLLQTPKHFQSYVCDFCNLSHQQSRFQGFCWPIKLLHSGANVKNWASHANESDIPIKRNFDTCTPSLYNYTDDELWVCLSLALVAQLSGNGLDLSLRSKFPHCLFLCCCKMQGPILHSFPCERRARLAHQLNNNTRRAPPRVVLFFWRNQWKEVSLGACFFHTWMGNAALVVIYRLRSRGATPTWLYLQKQSINRATDTRNCILFGKGASLIVFTEPQSVDGAERDSFAFLCVFIMFHFL